MLIKSQTPLQENLQRELSLMTSAWYDMTSRMQSDAIVVQRRSEAPKSFLNKQRRLVNNPVSILHAGLRFVKIDFIPDAAVTPALLNGSMCWSHVLQ